jgi:hypothetical protein
MGPATPRSRRLTLIAEEIAARLHPNSISKGWIRTVGDERMPMPTNELRKLRPKTNQP